MNSLSFNTHTHLLIVNADDFGCTPSIDQGILELLLARRISSFSAIVNELHSAQAAQSILQLKSSHPQVYENTSMGLHFNLTRGRPLSPLMRTSEYLEQGEFTKAFAARAGEEEVSEDQLADEFRQQVKQFMQLYKRRPSHVDGHNHVHLVPRVAKAIAMTMWECGIYKIRLPSQKDLANFSQQMSSTLKAVRVLYDNSLAIWPQVFLGGDQKDLNAERIKEHLPPFSPKMHLNTIQIMCHPGYPSEGQGWNSREDRLKEKMQLESQEFRELTSLAGGLGSYFDLQAKETLTPKLLIYSKLERGTGNYTTSLRLKGIFERIGYEVYTWSVEPDISPEVQAEDLHRFLISFGISLILGINVSRSAKIIHNATHSPTKVRIQVPYILVIAGTDANYTFQQPAKFQEMYECLSCSQCIVSISRDMTTITEEVLKKLNINKNVYTIVQSSALSPSPEICEEVEVVQRDARRYILFPTSFRRIKCVEHVFFELNEIIQKHNLKVLVVGPIIENDYYEQVRNQFGQIDYLGTISPHQYSEFLRNAFAVINCSQTEGMSCSLLEALQFGVPVIARSNSGNKELITHNFNGFIYESPEEFKAQVEVLINEPQLRETFIRNGKLIFNERYSGETEMQQYKCMIERQIKDKQMEVRFGQKLIRIHNEPHVHNTSEVNNQLFLQLEPQIGSTAKILDIGCGTAIFSLIYLMKSSVSRAQLHLVDINTDILGNALFNCRQSSMWTNLKIITICEDDFFHKTDKDAQFDIILFNPPQTPFQDPRNRLDKNGGVNGIKFYEAVLQYLSESRNRELYMLHSYLAWPAKLKELIDFYSLQCAWKSDRRVHKITIEQYDKMEPNLSAYIMKHWQEGRADISREQNTLSIPAEIQLITKK